MKNLAAGCLALIAGPIGLASIGGCTPAHIFSIVPISGDGGGAGGTAGGGGADGGATNPLAATFAYLFDSGSDGWAFNQYADPDRANLGDPASGASPALAFDDSAGDPDPGSLRVTATFTDWKQYVDAIILVRPPKDLTRRVLHARVRLVSGRFGGGAQIHAETGSGYKFAASAWTTLATGSWTNLELDLDAARAADTSGTFDPAMVVELGVKFDTGGDGVTTAFAGPNDVVFQIDTVSDGTVGAVPPPAVNHTFDSGAQSYALDTFADTKRQNLAAAGSPTTPSLTWDGSDGDPAPGSLKVTVTYSGYKQYVDPTVIVSPVDLTGQVLHAFVRLDAGAFSGAAQLHASSGAEGTFALGTANALTLGKWTELTMDLASAASSVSGFSPADVREIGVRLDTENGPGGAFGAAVAAVFHVDTVTAAP